MKRTKIVATIGPASMSKLRLKKMVKAGVNVCRLNFSHSDHIWHKKVIDNIRAVEKDLNVRIGILADLQGPRIRVANTEKVSLKEGEKIFLTDGLNLKKNKKKTLAFDWDGFYAYVKIGEDVFIEDGLIQLKITDIKTNGCVAEVVVAGEVKPHKAVNIPVISPQMNFLTDKDLFDLEFALKQRLDMIAASFVGKAKDLHRLHKMIEYFLEYKSMSRTTAKDVCGQEYYPWVISKIERKLAIKNLKDIIKISDGIMIARGDLAIEMPQKKVALLELDILKKTRRAYKPVIVATQMLASMEYNSRPTRAEISDVTTAVVNHTDAVMLSGESAMGKYPVKTVETMSDIIRETEKSRYDDLKLKNNKWARLLFGENRLERRRVMTAQNIKELLRFSALRSEKVKLRLSKRKLCDWGRAALVWGVLTDKFKSGK